MSFDHISWDLFGAFLAVMREGSLTGAARSLSAAQPTVRRQIEELEEQLGVILFTRSPQGLTPTDVAMQMLPYAEAMAATAHALVRAGTAMGEKVSGSVRITCTEEMASEVLPAILATLMAKHPALAIEISPSNRLEDLLRRRTDIALRMTQPKQPGLLTRRLSTIELGLFARPSYLAAHGIPGEPTSLRHHMMIGPENGGSMRALLDLMGLGESDLPLAYRSDSGLAQLAALRAGIGIGICQTSLAGPELIGVLSQFTLKLELWIAMQEDMRARTAVRTVFDHLAQEFRETEREVQSSSSSSTAAESTVERISL